MNDKHVTEQQIRIWT